MQLGCKSKLKDNVMEDNNVTEDNDGAQVDDDLLETSNINAKSTDTEDSE